MNQEYQDGQLFVLSDDDQEEPKAEVVPFPEVQHSNEPEYGLGDFCNPPKAQDHWEEVVDGVKLGCIEDESLSSTWEAYLCRYGGNDQQLVEELIDNPDVIRANYPRGNCKDFLKALVGVECKLMTQRQHLEAATNAWQRGFHHDHILAAQERLRRVNENLFPIRVALALPAMAYGKPKLKKLTAHQERVRVMRRLAKKAKKAPKRTLAQRIRGDRK